MTVHRASGTCQVCGKYEEHKATAKADAVAFVQHFHAGHMFQGDITVTEEPIRDWTKVNGRSARK